MDLVLISNSTSPPMPTPLPTHPPKLLADRHRELWTASSLRQGRLCVFGLLLGFLVQHKVTAPFVENWRERRDSGVALAASEERLVQTRKDLEGLESARERINAVARFLDDPPWEEAGTHMAADFAAIHASAELLGPQGDQVCRLLERKLPRDELVVRLPTAAQEIAEPLRITSGEVSAPLCEYLLQLDAAELVEASRVDGSFMKLPEAVIARAPLQLQTTLPGLSVGPLPKFNPEELGLLEASRNLDIAAEDLDAIPPQGWPHFVREQALKKLRSLAAETLTSVATSVEEGVLRPLEELSRDARIGTLASGSLESVVSRARADLTALEASHADLKWADTVDGKSAFVTDFQHAAKKALSAVDGTLQGLERTTAQAQEELSKAAQKEESAIDRLAVERDELGAKLAKLLPSWLANLITAEEMTMLHPLCVLAGSVYALYGAWQARRHFRSWAPSLLASGVDARLPAMSSVWTPVDRGRLGTVSMLSAYTGVGALALWLQFRGAEHANAFRTAGGADPFELGRLLPASAFLMALVAAIGFVALILALRADLRGQGTPGPDSGNRAGAPG